MPDKPVYETIDPTPIDLTTPDQEGGSKSAASVRRQHLLVPVIGAILLLAVITVVFLLPRWVAEKGGPLVEVTERPLPIVTDESPYRQAQLAEARQEAQKILAELIKAQDSLKALKVELWAADAFKALEETAANGDKLYQQGKFDIALEEYGDALSRANSLVEKSKTIVTTKLKTGEDAIAAGNQAAAVEAFELVLAIDSDNNQAQKGLARSKALEKTLPLLAQAKQAMEAGNWTSARQKLTDLLSLDADHQEARQLLSRVTRNITERDFNQAMSAGFTAMEAGNFTGAETQFAKAASLKPDSDDARSSLAQARSEQQARITANTLEKARSLESQEQWSEAADAYQQIVSRDDSVVAARVGLLRSRARADLHNRLEKILADPLRLSSGSVYVEAGHLLKDAKQIDSPGPVLRRQITALESSMAEAVAPVEVTLTSDNKTNVTVLRVGDLGTFETRNLSLRPGRYVALGSRPGYRDVRVPFEVAAQKTPTIAIVCTEPV